MHVMRVVGVTLTMTFVAAAQAQTGPSLLIKPWGDKPQWASTYDEPVFINDGHTKGDDAKIGILYYDSYGRVKLDHDNSDPGFWLGYRMLAIGIDGDQPNLPGDLNDLSIAAAFKLGEGADGWRVSLLVGAGTANDGHWSNGDAVYGIADINASQRIDEDTYLHIGVHYSGNRTFLPDVPLPYITYTHRDSESFSYAVGVPTSSVRWKPWDRVTIDANYTVPSNLFANISYALTTELSIFGEYSRTLDGFFQNKQSDRLFYDLTRVSTGVRWIKEPLIDVRAGIGYAFNQEFATGFDVRRTSTIARPSDEMLFFFTVQGSF